MEPLSGKRQETRRKRRKDVQTESAFKDRWRGGRHRESVAKWVDESGVKAHDVTRSMPKQETGRLPVLLNPPILKFYTDDSSTHRLVLSIFNPYDFAVKFKVLCTAPANKFSVIDPEGCIRPQYCVDLLIRHHEVNSEKNVDVEDKFRINMHENGNPRVFGTREVIAVLRRGMKELDDKSTKEQYQQIHRTRGVEPPPQFPLQRSSSQWKITARPNYVVVLTAVVCILALFVPTGDEDNSWFPDYVRLSVNQKCIISYVLGLVTMALFGLA